jgi:hypothetical protein
MNIVHSENNFCVKAGFYASPQLPIRCRAVDLSRLHRIGKRFCKADGNRFSTQGRQKIPAKQGRALSHRDVSGIKRGSELEGAAAAAHSVATPKWDSQRAPMPVPVAAEPGTKLGGGGLPWQPRNP